MTEIRLIWAFTLLRIARLREEPDRGELVPWVIITAGLAAAAIIIVAVVVAKVRATADSIQLQGPSSAGPRPGPGGGMPGPNWALPNRIGAPARSARSWSSR